MCGSILFFLMMVSINSVAKADPANMGVSVAERVQASANLRQFNLWMNAPWRDNDGNFAQVRNQIESSIQSGQKPADLMQLYKPDAKKYPDAAILQFRYYYAAYEAGIEDQTANGHAEAMIRVGDLFILILKGHLPHTYNYVRLGFLCALFSDPLGNYSLKNVGNQLFAKDPSDVLVKYALTSLLVDGPDPNDRTMALKYSLEMVHQYPSNLRIVGMLGYAYYVQWRTSHSKIDASHAIDAYQQYLDLAPADNYFRPTAQNLINEIRNSE